MSAASGNKRPGTAEVSIRNISKSFVENAVDTAVLDDISLDVRKGEIVVLFGPNGCGKTTLFNLLAGITQRTSGAIAFSCDADRVGSVFQDYRASLFPWRTLQANIQFGLELASCPQETARTKVEHYLTKFGLQASQHKYPYEVSGGMAQLTSLARTLVLDPEVLLLDEPFSSLDHSMAWRLLKELLGSVKENGITCMLVSHDVDEAIFLADRVLVLSPRPARIIGEFPISFAHRDRSIVATETFFGYRDAILHSFFSTMAHA